MIWVYESCLDTLHLPTKWGISLTLHFLILARRLLQSNICLILQAVQVYHWTRSTIAQRTSTMSLYCITQTCNSTILHKYTSTLHPCLFHTNIYLLRLGSEWDCISPHACQELHETIGSPLIVLCLRQSPPHYLFLQYQKNC